MRNIQLNLIRMLLLFALPLVVGCSAVEDWVGEAVQPSTGSPIVTPTPSPTPAPPPNPTLTNLSDKTFPNDSLEQGVATSFDVDNLATNSDTGMTYTCVFDQVVDGAVGSGTDCSSLSGFISFDSSTGILNWTPSLTTFGFYEIKFSGTNTEGMDEEIVVASVREGFSVTDLASYWDALFVDGKNPGQNAPLSTTWKDLWGSVDGTVTNVTTSNISYDQEVMADSPHAYWRLNETAGPTATDSSGNGFHGTYGGGITFSEPNSEILGSGGAVLFSNGYIQMPPLGMTLPLTIEFWAKPTTASPVGMFDSAPNLGNVLRNYNFGQVEWWSNSPLITLGLSANTWVHLAFTFRHDGTNRIIDWYKNGVLVGSPRQAAGASFAWTNLVWGRINGGGAGWYSGRLDELAVYKKALGAERIAAHYRSATRGGRDTGWVGTGTTNISTANDGPLRIEFDGSNDYVDLSSNLNTSSNVTAEAWVHPANPVQSGKVIFGNGDASEKGFVIKQNGGSGRVQISMGSNNTYVDEVMADQPTGYWRLNEKLGKTAYDLSGNNQNGTFTSNFTLNQTGALSGDNNTAVAFNGTAGYVTTKHTVGATMTLELWATYSGVGNKILWITGPDGTGPDAYFNGGLIALNTWDGTTNSLCAIPGDAADGNFHHYVFVVDAGGPSATLYYDGALCGSATYRNPTGTLRFPSDATVAGPFYWDGKIDEVAIYPTALTLPRIQAHYAARNRVTCQSESNLTGDLWHYLTGVFDSAGPTLKLLVNGQEECSVTAAGATFTGSTSPLRLGADNSGTNAWPGGMASAKFYNSALASGTVASNMKNTWNRFPDIPKSIPKLSVWLKADAITGLSDGSSVSSWSDSSGNAYHATQATPANQPVFKENILNGLPVLRFNGTTTGLDTTYKASRTNFPNLSVIVVSKASVIDGTYRTFWSFDGATGGYNRSLVFITGAFGLQGGSAPNAINVTPNTNFNIHSAIYSISESNYWLYENGVGTEKGNVETTPGNDNALTIGYIPCCGNQYLNGDIAELIIFEKKLTDTERRRIEAYLKAKYGL